MNSEKDTTAKPIHSGKPTEDQGARQAQNAGAKNTDAQRHPEEQNVVPKAFVQDKNKTNLNGSPSNQKV